MNCFTVLGIEPTTEKKTIKRAYAAKSREFHPEEHPEEFQRIHDAYEEALAWAERNAGREEEPQMPEEPRRMERKQRSRRRSHGKFCAGEKPDEKSSERRVLQSENLLAYEELPVQGEIREEGRHLYSSGKFPTWDSDWTRQFQNMADASERQGADDREVRKIMEQCISLYLNEKERNKLYHWKDILEEPAYREYFRTKTFVESWYHFLDTHRMFDAAIWQYFQWIDGKLFSALEADVMPFAYPTQEEIERMPRQETPEQTQERRTPEPGPALPKVKKEKSKAVKVLLYLVALAGTGIGGMILGIIAGTILG
ncbi:MAG: DnaJ domain-containing protein [Coprococcus comes]